MPIAIVKTTAVICENADGSAVHITGTGSGLSLEFFFAAGWTVLPGTDTRHAGVAYCPACTKAMAGT